MRSARGFPKGPRIALATALAGLVVSVAPARAQHAPAPLRVLDDAHHAGTFRWADKSWAPPGPEAAGAVAYANTCKPPTGTVWTTVGPCNTFYDQGRIPSLDDPSYAGLAGMANDQRIVEFTFGYCTRAVQGTVDLTLTFWETGGDCAAGVVPDPAAAAAVFDFGAATGFPLPGSNFAGQTTCWTVTIDLTGTEFCLTADGDEVWDDDPSDRFVYGFHTDNTDATGPTLAGNPFKAPGGNCIFGGSCSGCATGLDASDGFYAEQLCPAGFADGCYDMGGWPSFPYASFYLELRTAGPCSCAGLEVSYCTAGTSASGCQAQLSAQGAASVSQPSGFLLTASSVEGAKDGIFFFGTGGRQASPWGNGTSYLCVVPPVKRGGLMLGSGANGGCNGSFQMDLNALWVGAPAKAPPAGAWVQSQLWYRDPGSSSNQNTSLSDGLEFPVCP